MALDYRSIKKEAIAQGWRVEVTKSGERLVPPSKELPAVQVHRTPSDQRAIRNFLAQMKRSGLAWPPPSKGKE